MIPFLNKIADAMGGSVLGSIVEAIKLWKLPAEKEAELLDKVAAREHELELALTQQITAQLEINKIEAAHHSRFVSGWRPFIGWVCGAGLAWEFVLKPFSIFFVQVFGATLPPMPDMGIGELMALVQGMLGMAALRTYERKNRVERAR
ncbi:MAG: hypothetical protein CV089_02225 [Nitrospira sp. WS110]|nr:hypothetical protein [Nitrospira sp. WS110]